MEKTYNRIIGEYLGYSPCCIKAFGDVAIMFSDRPVETRLATVNGFLPCISCANKLLNQEITYDQLINFNRKCTVPFSHHFTREQDKQVSLELDQLTNN